MFTSPNSWIGRYGGRHDTSKDNSSYYRSQMDAMNYADQAEDYKRRHLSRTNAFNKKLGGLSSSAGNYAAPSRKIFGGL